MYEKSEISYKDFFYEKKELVTKGFEDPMMIVFRGNPLPCVPKNIFRYDREFCADSLPNQEEEEE